jgi:hypothetical protein
MELLPITGESSFGANGGRIIAYPGVPPGKFASESEAAGLGPGKHTVGPVAAGWHS